MAFKKLVKLLEILIDHILWMAEQQQHAKYSDNFEANTMQVDEIRLFRKIKSIFSSCVVDAPKRKLF